MTHNLLTNYGVLDDMDVFVRRLRTWLARRAPPRR